MIDIDRQIYFREVIFVTWTQPEAFACIRMRQRNRVGRGGGGVFCFPYAGMLYSQIEYVVCKPIAGVQHKGAAFAWTMARTRQVYLREIWRNALYAKLLSRKFFSFFICVRFYSHECWTMMRHCKHLIRYNSSNCYYFERKEPSLEFDIIFLPF